MAERFETTTEEPGVWMLAKKANVLNSATKSIEKVKAIAAKEAYENKIDQMLDAAKVIDAANPRYTYGLGARQFVCDTFIKYLYRQASDHSLDKLYGTAALYKNFSPDKKNVITSPSNYSFSVAGTLNPGDLMFFVDDKWNCWHVAMFSRKDFMTWDIYVYDASTGYGTGERKLRPNELRPPFTYRNIYYTPPVFAA